MKIHPFGSLALALGFGAALAVARSIGGGLGSASVADDPYGPDPGPERPLVALAHQPGERIVVPLPRWKFQRGDVAGAKDAGFDDRAFRAVAVPHTWNALDGQDGPRTPYYRGPSWYRLRLRVPDELHGKRLYLQFDGANLITDVFVDGVHVGCHRGGYARFRFEATSQLTPGREHVVAVRVDNSAGADDEHQLVPGSPTVDVAPLSADYTFFGGLYREVSLLGIAPVSVEPMDYGASGLYVTQANVSEQSADVALTVKLRNARSEPRTLRIVARVVDATGIDVLTLEGDKALDAGQRGEIVLHGNLTTPHLWAGRADPYLYRVCVAVRDDAAVVDTVCEPLGLRTFALDPERGFSLNGRYLDLHGVNIHQDRAGKGWAIRPADTDADFALLDEIGATAVRLAHYQHAQHTYDLADAQGFVVWAETPVINRIAATPAFAENAEQQLLELIRQNYNHPSIAFWSVGNEVLLRSGPDPDALIARLSEVAAREDPTRLVAYAGNPGSEESPVNWHGAAHGFNEYQGWYANRVADFARWADALHAAHPRDAIGVTEFGAGASVTQHEADPVSEDDGDNHTSGAHSEEYQAYYHEGVFRAMAQRPFLWGKFVWNGFDFASDGRDEGTTPGLNDKGLVSYDRSLKKDAFYWYKAQWSRVPFVHITSRRFTDLPREIDHVKVYSNAPKVELFLNGKSLGTRNASDGAFVFRGVPWVRGANRVEARAAGTASDQVTWQN